MPDAATTLDAPEPSLARSVLRGFARVGSVLVLLVAWEALVREYDCDRWPPLILAGGLTFANIAQAIAATDSWGVDVASGVESSPGIKDPELVRQFVENARLK